MSDKVYARRVKDIPLQFRDPNVNYEKYANEVIYVDSAGRPISGNVPANYDVSNVTWWNPSLLTTGQTQLEEADKRMTEKRSADEHVAENYGSKAWGKVGALMGAGAIAAGGLSYALPWIDAALTPSTYFDLLGAPSWAGTTANLGASGYYLYDNGKRFINDPTFENGVYTTLSLIPMFRSNYDLLGKFGRYIKEQRLASALNNDIRNAQFTIRPIKHATTKGITEGAGLRAASDSDVMFHFSDINGKVPEIILKELGHPFIREGWWTYTNNTAPIKVEDPGLWTSDVNPDFYKGLDSIDVEGLNPTTKDVLMALLKGTNFDYVNKYEGNEISHATSNPSFGIYLSKNIEAPSEVRPLTLDANNMYDIDQYVIRQPNGSYLVGDNEYKLINGIPHKINTYEGPVPIGENSLTDSLFQDFLKNEHVNFISNLSPLNRELYLNNRASKRDFYTLMLDYLSKNLKLDSTPELNKLAQESLRNDFDEVVDTYDYRRRLSEAGVSDVEGVIKLIKDLISKLNYVIVNEPPIVSGMAHVHNGENFIGLNPAAFDVANDANNNTLWHEFMHNVFANKGYTSDFTPIDNEYMRNNLLYIGDPNKYIEKYVPSFERDYLTDPNELHSRVMEVVKMMIKEGVDDPAEAYDIYEDLIKKNWLNYFNKDYMIKLLGSLYATTAIVNSKKDSMKNGGRLIPKHSFFKKGGILKFKDAGILRFTSPIPPIDNSLDGLGGEFVPNSKQFDWSILGLHTNRYNKNNNLYLNEIYNISKSYGYNDNQIAAILANAILENQGSPAANNGKYGLFQFLASLKDDVGDTIESSIKAFHRDYQYGKWYDTKDKNGWNPVYHKYFKDGQTPEDTAYGMAAGYERYGGASNRNNAETKTRMKLARAIYNIINRQ